MSSNCRICHKSVCLNDPQIKLDGCIHFECAKCAYCGCQITLMNFHKTENPDKSILLLCKPHSKRVNESRFPQLNFKMKYRPGKQIMADPANVGMTAMLHVGDVVPDVVRIPARPNFLQQIGQRSQETENSSATRIPKRYCFDEEKLLSKGSFGWVFAAEDHVGGLISPVAIKKIETKLLHEYEKDALRGSNAEGAILKTLDHPHIIKCFDFFETSNTFYVVMELGEGAKTTLRAHIFHCMSC